MELNETHSGAGRQERTPERTETSSPPREPSSRSPETQRTPKTDADRASAISELLNGRTPEPDTASADGDQGPDPEDYGGEHLDDGPPEPQEGAQDADQQSPPPKPTTLKEAAERLGIEPEDAYKLTLTTGDGEGVTLGQMKDAYVAQETARRETAQREASLDERETAITRSQQLWAQLGDRLEHAIPRESRQQLAQHLDERNAREQRMLMQVAPELQDETVLNTFRDDVVKTLGKYGYKPHEVVIGDHRQALVIRDLIRAQKRLEALRDYKPERQPPRTKSGAKAAPTGSKARVVNKARHGTEADKVAGVSALLRG